MDLQNLNKERRQRKKASSELPTGMIYGKVPPQAMELEEAVLGALLLDKNAIDVVSGILKKEAFYKQDHQLVYESILELSSKNTPIDIFTVVENLKTRDRLEIVGGPYAITKLTNSVVSSANILTHARIIIQKFIQREVIRISGEAIEMAYEDSTDVFDLLDIVEQSILSIGTSTFQNEMSSIDQVLVETMKKIEDWRQIDGTLTGVPSGFPELDRVTRGWQPQSLIILAARPSVGKTALALQLLDAAANNPLDPDACAAMWSLEMPAMRLALRMLSAKSKIILHKIQTGRLDDAEMRELYAKGVSQLAKSNIYFDDSSSMTLMSLRAKARRLKKKGEKPGNKKLRLIVVDYLQLMEGESSRKGNREQEVSGISRGLKNLAKELDVPIIALSQLSRDLEKKGGVQREPKVSDLRESGAIEQDADIVCLLWGPDDDEVQKNPGLLNRRWLRIGKHRDGMLKKITLEFRNEIQQFSASDENEKGGYRPVTEALDLFSSDKDLPM